MKSGVAVEPVAPVESVTTETMAPVAASMASASLAQCVALRDGNENERDR